MKKILFLALSVLISFPIFSQKLEYTYQLGNPEVKKIGEYQLLFYPNSKQLGKVGSPALPYLAVNLLLPPNTVSKSIKFSYSGKTKLSGDYKLYPQQHVSPTNTKEQSSFIINDEIYQSERYPERKSSNISTEYMNGYGFAMSKFTPIEYNAKTGEVFYYKTVKVTVSYRTNDTDKSAFISTRQSVKDRVFELAQNKDAVSKYNAQRKNLKYDMLIITTDAYSTKFDELTKFHLERGIRSKIITISDINSVYDGVDQQEKIRNCIIHEYQTFDIQYVMLGGDAEIVPHRGFYCSVQSSSAYVANDIPADLYYSSLDGNWNTDGDNLWAEPGEDDLLPEVAIGRIPFSTEAELAIIIHKITHYTNQPVLSTGELKKPLLATEKLHDDPLTWGANYLDLIIGQHDDNGYSTNGINTEYKFISARENTWNGDGASIISEINKGYSFIHHVGHANADFMMGLYNADITKSNFSSLDGTTHNYTLVYSHGCICGSFDADDCVSERMVTLETFAVGVFTNSRYGWFNEGQTEGPSQHLHREFVNSLYTQKENHAGMAELISKQKTAPWVDKEGEFEPGAQRWCFYDHNVLTDPALPIWTNDTVKFVVDVQADNKIGEDLTVTVTDGSAPQSNYTCVLLQNNKFIGKATTNAQGIAIINIDPNIAAIGNADVFISGYNALTKKKQINITASDEVVLAVNEISFSSNNNPNIEEETGLKIKIKNFGSQKATNVKLVLSSDDSNIEILSSQIELGDLNGLDNIESNGDLKIKSVKVKDQYSTNLKLQVFSDQNNITKIFPVTVNAPKLQVSEIKIEETDGDGDNIIEVGEKGKISFIFSNVGHYKSSSLTSNINSESNEITITTPDNSYNEIAVGETFTVTSDFDISTSSKTIDLINIRCKINAGFYSTQASVGMHLGELIEDFETSDFNKFAWTFGETPWTITTSNVYAGTNSAVSGTIENSKASYIQIKVNLSQAQDISFFRKVSSEDTYDALSFYVDVTEKDKWSGNIDWTKSTYNIPAGKHTLKWEYKKDDVMSDGSDCAWLDNITLPVFSVIPDVVACKPVSDNDRLLVYPTVFSDKVIFEYTTTNTCDFNIEIYNIAGQLIYSKTEKSNIGNNSFILEEADNFNSGIYLYKINYGQKYSSGKIIKR